MDAPETSSSRAKPRATQIFNDFVDGFLKVGNGCVEGYRPPVDR